MSTEHTHDEHADFGDPCGDGYYVHAHITPVKTNLIVISILFVLTGATIAAYEVRLGEWNLAVALLIASVKATLVGTWFMHLKYEKAFNTSFFLGAILFMAIFFGYTSNDTGHRGRVDGVHGTQRDARTGEYASGSAIGYEHGEFVAIPALPAGHGEHGAAAEGHEASGEHAAAAEHAAPAEAEAAAPAEAAPAEEAAAPAEAAPAEEAAAPEAPAEPGAAAEAAAE